MRMIRLAAPDLDREDLDAVCGVLQSGFLVQGQEVEAFEQRIKDVTGSTYAIAVSSCTAALHLGLLALQVGPGDRVAVAAYSWPASANVIALCGASPVFVDIDPQSFNMDPRALDRALCAAAPVKAVMPVHAFGAMAAMKEIKAIAAHRGVLVIEDAACALGARLDGHPAGTWGDVGCFSFHPRKLVTTGEGGAVVTNSAEIAAQVRALRNHGQAPNAPKPDFVLPGFNYRLTEFQAALGRAQMAKLDRLLTVRHQLAGHYHALLDNTGVLCPVAPQQSAHTYQSYVVLLPTTTAEQRDRAVAYLRSSGVEAGTGTHHLPLTTYWRRTLGCREGDFPGADMVAARAVTLPLHTGLSSDDQRRVVAALQAALDEVMPSRVAADG
jgi:dTDP-4-amino-4,6-dideoxygalactose transaminase